MSAKNYEKRCARLVQEATGRSYQYALNAVRKHQAAHPELMSLETRALQIVEESP